MNFNFCGFCGNTINNECCVSCGKSVAIMLSGTINDHLTLFDMATAPELTGWCFDLRHMVLDRLHFNDPERRLIWITAMTRWADSKGAVNFIAPTWNVN